MIKFRGFSALAFAAAASTALAGDQSFEDFFGSYFHRTDTIAVGAGDAKNVNAMSEILDPWPPHVRNRRLPANGARMTGAIERYEDVRKLKEAPTTLAPEAINATGLSSNASGR
jgi:hypothetical protein